MSYSYMQISAEVQTDDFACQKSLKKTVYEKIDNEKRCILIQRVN